MPVVPLVPGATVTTAGVVALHDTIRTAINSIQNSDLGRFTFNHEQLESILVSAANNDTIVGGAPFEVEAELDETEVNAPSFDSVTPSPAGVLMDRVINWNVPSAKGLNLPPCYVFVFANVDITGWTDQNDPAFARQCAVLGLSISIGAGDPAPIGNANTQGVVRANTTGQLDEFSTGTTAGQALSQEKHQTAALMGVYDGTAGTFTITNLSLWAGACEAGSTEPLEPGAGAGFYRISRAQISFFAIRAA